MADTITTRATLVTNFANNSSGAITPQMLRNFLYSTVVVDQYGQATDSAGVATGGWADSGGALGGGSDISVAGNGCHADSGSYCGQTDITVNAMYKPAATNCDAHSGGVAGGPNAHAAATARVFEQTGTGFGAGTFIYPGGVNAFATNKAIVAGDNSIGMGNSGADILYGYDSACIGFGSTCVAYYAMCYGYGCIAIPSTNVTNWSVSMTAGGTSILINSPLGDQTANFNNGDVIYFDDTSLVTLFPGTVDTSTYDGGSNKTTITLESPFNNVSTGGGITRGDLYGKYASIGINCSAVANPASPFSDAKCVAMGYGTYNANLNSAMYGFQSSNSAFRGTILCTANGVQVSGVAAKIGGTIFDGVTVTSTNSTSEQTLYTNTFAFATNNPFAVNQDKIEAHYAGTFASVAQIREFKLYYDNTGATAIYDSGSSVPSGAGAWDIKVTLRRVSATSVAYVVVASFTGMTGITTQVTSGTVAVSTLASNNSILAPKVTQAVSATAGDVVAYQGYGKWIPAA